MHTSRFFTVDDAGFNRTSISKIVTEQGFEYSIPRGWEAVTQGDGTVVLDDAQRSVVLSIGTASGSRAMLQSKAATRWRWGHSMTLFLTGVINYLATTITGNTKIRWGIFDDNDGLFTELDSSGMYMVFRTSISGSPVDIRIPQSSWSDDKLDGSGLSRFNADWTRAQRMWYSASSPGGGRGRVGCYVTDRLVQASQLSSINSRTSVPFLRTSSQPHRVEIVNAGGAGSGGKTQLYSAAMIEEGPTDEGETGYISACGNGVAGKTISSTEYTPLFSIRLRDTFNNFKVRGRIIPESIKLLNEGNSSAHLRIIENAALTGASFSNLDSNNSIIEVSTAETALTGGMVIDSDYITGSQKGVSSLLFNLPNKVSLARSYADVRDTLTFAARSIGGTTVLYAEATIRELF